MIVASFVWFLNIVFIISYLPMVDNNMMGYVYNAKKKEQNKAKRSSKSYGSFSMAVPLELV